MLESHDFESIVLIGQQKPVGFRENIKRPANVKRLNTRKGDYGDVSHERKKWMRML